MEDIHLLISRFLDGELSDEEIRRLSAAVAGNVVITDALVIHSFIHAQLLDWMNHEAEQGGETGTRIEIPSTLLAMIGGRAEFSTLGHDSRPNSEVQPSPLNSKTRKRFSFPMVGALAASLVLAASILIVGYVVASRPTIVGQLTDATGCRWASAPPAGIGVGTLLESGQELSLLQGQAVITFASGAKLHLEGPTSLQLISASQVQLANGRIAAKVPRHAIGFTVASSLARFVDLGTAFTLSLESEKSFQLHVFEGLVELQLDKRFGKAALQPVRVADVHAVFFDIQSGDVAKMHFEEGKTMPF